MDLCNIFTRLMNFDLTNCLSSLIIDCALSFFFSSFFLLAVKFTYVFSSRTEADQQKRGIFLIRKIPKNFLSSFPFDSLFLIPFDLLSVYCLSKYLVLSAYCLFLGAEDENHVLFGSTSMWEGFFYHIMYPFFSVSHIYLFSFILRFVFGLPTPHMSLHSLHTFSPTLTFLRLAVR